MVYRRYLTAMVAILLLLIAATSRAGGMVVDDEPELRGNSGAGFGALLFLLLIWLAFFASRETRKFLLVLPLLVGMPVVMILIWLVSDRLPTDYSIKNWGATAALGWIGFWVGVLAYRLYLGPEKQATSADSNGPILHPENARPNGPTSSPPSDSPSPTGPAMPASGDPVGQQRDAPAQAARSDQVPPKAKPAEPNRPARSFDRARALQAVSGFVPSGKSLSDIEQVPAVATAPHAEVAGDLNSSDGEVYVELFDGDESATVEFTKADLERFRTNAMDPATKRTWGKPDQTKPYINILAGEYFCIAENGFFHNHMHGWVRRNIPAEEDAYWRQRISEIRRAAGDSMI